MKIKSADDLISKKKDMFFLKNSDFFSIVSSTMEEEGGYVNDISDRGGETKYGISKRTYPFLDIKNLKVSDAITIYYYDWWLNYKFDLIEDFDLKKKLFSMAVNMGFKKAFSILQSTMNDFNFVENKLVVDGVMGEKSISSINSLSPNFLKIKLLLFYKYNLIKYYHSLGNEKYIKGWTKRVLL